MILRPYQQAQIDDLRHLLKTNRAVMAQLATGGGKTAEFSAIVKSAYELGRIIWVIAPRNELLDQASKHIRYSDVSHSFIKAGKYESLAFNVHVVSGPTINIRMGKLEDGNTIYPGLPNVKQWPDLVIIDEAHLALDFQLKLVEFLDQGRAMIGKPPTKIIGFTATPERLDGRGLTEIYDNICYGPSIKELSSQGFLTGLDCFSPPLDGLKELHTKGTDYDEDELADLLERKKIYGSVIAHYKEYAQDKATLAFCRSVKAAKDTAERFQEAGFNFEYIDGLMAKSKQSMLVDATRTGKIKGLTNCNLLTIGVDIPRLECGIMLRPTLSRSLFHQMVGRILRPYADKSRNYVKIKGILLDHVNNLDEHGHPFDPIDWNFAGDRKRKKKDGISVASLKRCTSCWLHFEGPVCPNCGGTNEVAKHKDLVEVDGRLVKREPMKMAERPYQERVEIAGRGGECIKKYNEGDLSAVAELLKIASEIKNKPMWAYWRFSEGKKEVDIDLLKEIARVKDYKPGWVRREIENVGRRLEQ